MFLGPRLAPALLALLVSGQGPGDAPTALRPAPPPAGWSALAPGLELATFDGPSPARGDGKIWIVRVDLARHELKVVNASASDGRPRTVQSWVKGAGGVAGINAGMFQTDGLTSVGLLRTRLHENNPRRSTRYKAMLALDPLRPGEPPLRIIDAACGEADALFPAYGTLLQSIRMVSCDRKNVWAPDAKRWSAAAIAVDGAGRALFVHARSPWPVHDLVDALLALPIDLRRAMYLEGGPEAQLYARGAGREVERVGAVEGSDPGREGSAFAWEIPNAIVAVPRVR